MQHPKKARLSWLLVLESVGKIPAQNRAVNLRATLLDSCMVWPSNFDHEKLDVYQLELKLLYWNEFNPAKKCCYVLWPCLRNVERFDPYQYRVREGAQGLTEPLEDEDDDEHEAAVATLWRALAGAGRDVGLRRAQSSRLAKSGRLIS